MKKKLPNFYYVYIITNTFLNKQYIGSRVCYKDKIEEDGYWGSSKYLNEDYKIYGKENFTKKILKSDCKDKIELLNEESRFIIEYNTLAPNGYNRFLPNSRSTFTMIGVYKIPWNKGKKLSEEQKKNMKRPKSENHKMRVGLTKIGNKNMLGKHHTSESKELMRNAKLGTHHSEEHNKNFSKARKGVQITPTSKMECKYCNKLIDKRNFSRWHGDNCKFK